MKKTITKEQWDELTNKQKLNLFSTKNIADISKGNDFIFEMPNIGRMIEILGEDFDSLGKIDKTKNFYVFAFGFQRFDKNNLCDALWEAIKYKFSINKNISNLTSSGLLNDK